MTPIKRRMERASIFFSMLRDNGTVWDSFSIPKARSFLWDDLSGVDHPARQYVKDWVKAHFKDKPSFLDVPCGAGVDMKVMEGLVQYTGVDKTRVFIDLLREAHPDTTFHHADIRDIPVQDNAFDVVSARAIFEHLCDVQDVEHAMKECFRVAKKYCIFSFFIPLIDSPTEIDWNGKWFNNHYNRTEIEDIINSFDTKDIEYKHIGVRGTEFIDSYDIFILHKK